MPVPQQKPSKEKVREWLYGQIAKKVPPPSSQQIRDELSWGMLPNNKSAVCAR